MLRFKSLGSGSAGNAMLVEATGLMPLRVLIDCGLGLKHLKHRLGEAGLQPEDLHAVFITHEHSDHTGCVRTLSLRYKIPVWMSHGTYTAMGAPDFSGLLRMARDGDLIDLGGMQLTPFTVPHDAKEPLQLSCTDGLSKLGILTDLGHATAHVLSHIKDCDGLVLECNHDIELLAQSVYPAFLKQRVGGNFGHLSNAAAGTIAKTVFHHRLKHLVAAHLSEQNNRPDLAREVLSEATGFDKAEIIVASALGGTPWLHL